MVVSGCADAPEVSLEGLFAVRIVLLCEEVLLVGVDIHQVLFACFYCCCYGCETSTCPELIRGRSGRALIGPIIQSTS